MQSPWTRDGKIRAEQVSITPQVSGRIVELNIKDNQLVNAGDLLLTIDKTPFQIAELNARAEEGIDPRSLVSSGELPVLEKYDSYVPADLLQQAYATDKLNPTETEIRIREILAEF